MEKSIEFQLPHNEIPQLFSPRCQLNLVSVTMSDKTSNLILFTKEKCLARLHFKQKFPYNLQKTREKFNSKYVRLDELFKTELLWAFYSIFIFG